MNGELKDDAKESSDELDAALAASFPASDPPAMTDPVAATPLPEGVPELPAPPVAVFRVVKRDEAGTAFGAQDNINGGRWTSQGVPAVYASESAAGAVLEFLAHLEGNSPDDLVLVSASLPREALVVGDSLPAQWRERPYRSDVRAYGDEWARSRRSLALQLPSVLCEQSCNVLINPAHPDASELRICAIDPLTLDPRLRY
jgi:RES domain-containing protein